MLRFVLISFIFHILTSVSISSEINDEYEYNTLCGPISAYVALRSLGENPDFESVVLECGWDDSNSLTSVDHICKALEKNRMVSAIPQKITFEHLNKQLDTDGVAILITKSTNNRTPTLHAVCFIDHDPKRGYQYIDYPNGKIIIKPEQLKKIWTGETILVSHSVLGRFQSQWYYLIIPFLALFVVYKQCFFKSNH
tara:strand:+ start:6899 stop:7486 length:588 start_codon:yes stop_codon:yes gene_type:complete